MIPSTWNRAFPLAVLSLAGGPMWVARPRVVVEDYLEALAEGALGVAIGQEPQVVH